jgi:hypothetical protein
MRNTIIVLADLGSFKAYQVKQDTFGGIPRLESLESAQPASAQARRLNRLTVLEGKSASHIGGRRASSSSSDGEQHSMELEKRRRIIKTLVNRLQQLIDHDGELRCFLAAPGEILAQILETLEPAKRKRVEKALPLDLKWATKSKILDCFFPRVRTGGAQPAAGWR